MVRASGSADLAAAWTEGDVLEGREVREQKRLLGEKCDVASMGRDEPLERTIRRFGGRCGRRCGRGRVADAAGRRRFPGRSTCRPRWPEHASVCPGDRGFAAHAAIRDRHGDVDAHRLLPGRTYPADRYHRRDDQPKVERSRPRRRPFRAEEDLGGAARDAMQDAANVNVAPDSPRQRRTPAIRIRARAGRAARHAAKPVVGLHRGSIATTRGDRRPYGVTRG